MRLRVLHVIGGLGLGGAEALLFRLVTRRPDVSHEVICLGGRGWYSDKLEQHGVPVTHLQMNRKRSLPSILSKLYRLIRRSDADVVQTWLYTSNLLGGFVAKLAGKPAIWGIHSASLGPYPWKTRLMVRVGGVVAPWVADCLICCSPSAANSHAKLGYSTVPCATILNGYDPERWTVDEAARRAKRRELGVSPEHLLIGCFSRWDPYKDVPSLLSALNLLAKEGISFTCVLLGKGLGSENAVLAAAITRARCDDFVVPLGQQADLSDFARALDLHVLPSRTEAFPNVVAETMLAGVPNIATAVGDTALMIGDTGWVIPPCDPRQLAAAIHQAAEECANEPARWEQRRAAARARIAENFGFTRMADSYEQVWRRFAKLRSRAVSATLPQ
jgi:glycosyltransferase involved in cell wall biosynthesis